MITFSTTVTSTPIEPCNPYDLGFEPWCADPSPFGGPSLWAGGLGKNGGGGSGPAPAPSNPPSQQIPGLTILPFQNQRSCGQIGQDVQKVRDELARRFQQYTESALPLPTYGKFSRAGHVQAITNTQTQLRNLLNEFQMNGCGGTTTIPPDAWQLATQQAPQVTPSRPGPIPFAIGGAAVALTVGLTGIFAPEFLPFELALVP
jgi:hypothetical protein